MADTVYCASSEVSIDNSTVKSLVDVYVSSTVSISDSTVNQVSVHGSSVVSVANSTAEKIVATASTFVSVVNSSVGWFSPRKALIANSTLSEINLYFYADANVSLNPLPIDLVNSITNITTPSFEYVTLGPFTTDALSGGKHSITAKVYKSGELIDTYTHEVKTTIAEDINLDFKVDMKDIGTAAKAFGSYPGHERWEVSADINNDNKVNMKDIGRIAKEFGTIDQSPLFYSRYNYYTLLSN